ncbi:MAG: hypothetical protein ACR2M0_07150 [Chloroflexia bacterium]
MWADIPIYRTDEFLILKLAPTPPIAWYEVMAIADGDKQDQKLYNIEVFLYEEPLLSVASMVAQFEGAENITVLAEYGLLNLRLRKGPVPHPGFGFGRDAALGIDQFGRVSVLRLAWNEPGASTPTANPEKALADLPHRVGLPTWDY